MSPPTLKEGGLSPLHFSDVDTFQYALHTSEITAVGRLQKHCESKISKFSWGSMPPDHPRWLLALAFEAQLTVVEHSSPCPHKISGSVPILHIT